MPTVSESDMKNKDPRCGVQRGSALYVRLILIGPKLLSYAEKRLGTQAGVGSAWVPHG